MFCKKCGKKIQDNSKYCKYCCASQTTNTQKVMDESHNKDGEVIAVPKNEGNISKLSKKNKILIISILVAVICIVGAFKMVSYIMGPTYVANKYIKALCNVQYEKAYEYLDVEEQEFLNKENYVSAMKYIMYEEPYKIKHIECIDQTDRFVTYDVSTTMDEYIPLNKHINLVLKKTEKKRLGIFDSWVVIEDGVVSAKDWPIAIPKGSKLSINNITVDKGYMKQEEKINENNDAFMEIYYIKIYPGFYDVEVSLDGAEIYEEKIENTFGICFVDLEPTDDTLNILREVADIVQKNWLNAINNHDMTLVEGIVLEDSELWSRINDRASNEYFNYTYTIIENTPQEVYIDDYNHVRVFGKIKYEVKVPSSTFGEGRTDQYNSEYVMFFIKENNMWKAYDYDND